MWGGGCSEWWHLSSKAVVWWSPAVLRMAEHLPPMGSGEWVPCSALLVCMDIALVVKLSFNSNHEGFFPFLPFKFSPPSHQRGVRKQHFGILLLSGIKPWHSSRFKTVEVIIKLTGIHSFCQEWNDLSFGTVNNNAIPCLEVSLRWSSRETKVLLPFLSVCGSAWLSFVHPPLSLALLLRTASDWGKRLPCCI